VHISFYLTCREAAEFLSRATSPARGKILSLHVLCVSSEAGGEKTKKILFMHLHFSENTIAANLSGTLKEIEIE
jgi:hypothetical protein